MQRDVVKRDEEEIKMGASMDKGERDKSVCVTEGLETTTHIWW